eukprot:TRINITY_DN2171_c0_g1_i1.p1 TRINITY_DN2171_c0_g1~~TRINITY_DN2171_c0_g1_i1.p1  ORF type:complete len:593 (+),score=58.47 TRINITY_DN2171_c0_g1_i1:1-1779(+)
MLLCSMGILFGCCYRISAVGFFLTSLYFFLLDKMHYSDFAYLTVLFAFLMTLVPAHQIYSIDSWVYSLTFGKKAALKNRMNVPAWTMKIFRAQLVIILFVMLFNKCNTDFYQGFPRNFYSPFGFDDWIGDHLSLEGLRNLLISSTKGLSESVLNMGIMEDVPQTFDRMVESVDMSSNLEYLTNSNDDNVQIMQYLNWAEFGMHGFIAVNLFCRYDGLMKWVSITLLPLLFCKDLYLLSDPAYFRFTFLFLITAFLFFAPRKGPSNDQPLKILSKKEKKAQKKLQQKNTRKPPARKNEKQQKKQSRFGFRQLVVTLVLLLYLSVQIYLPLRHMHYNTTVNCWDEGFYYFQWNSPSGLCRVHTLQERYYLFETQVQLQIGMGEREIFPKRWVLQPLQRQYSSRDFDFLFDKTVDGIFANVKLLRRNWKKPVLKADIWKSVNGRPYQRWLNSSVSLGDFKRDCVSENNGVYDRSLCLTKAREQIALPLIESYGDVATRAAVQDFVERERGHGYASFYSFADFPGMILEPNIFAPLHKRKQIKAIVEVFDGEIQVFDMVTMQEHILKKGHRLTLANLRGHSVTTRGPTTAMWAYAF